MFEQLITLYLEEQKQYKQYPYQYRCTTVDFYKVIEEIADFKEFIYTETAYNNRFWVNFYLAWAIKLIHQNEGKIFLDESCLKNSPDFYSKEYLWTAFMILGMILPDNKFGSERLHEQFPEQENFFSRNIPTSIYKKLFKDNINEGVFSTFSSKSYAKIFKNNIEPRTIRAFLYHTSIERTQQRRIDEEKQNDMLQVIRSSKDFKSNQDYLDSRNYHYLTRKKCPQFEGNEILDLWSDEHLAYKKELEEYRACEKDYEDYANFFLANKDWFEIKWKTIGSYKYYKSEPHVLNPFKYNYNFDEEVITGLDINYRETKDGATLLVLAVIGKKYLLAENLLKSGADPLIENFNLEIASDLVPLDSPIFATLKGYELIYATFNGDLKKIQSIINEGADVNFQGIEGYTALMIAVENNFVALITFLLKIGADLKLTRSDGQGVFDLVDNTEVLNILNTELLPMLEELTIEEEQKNEDLEDESKEAVASKTKETPTSIKPVFFSSAQKAIPNTEPDVQKGIKKK